MPDSESSLKVSKQALVLVQNSLQNCCHMSYLVLGIKEASEALCDISHDIAVLLLFVLLLLYCVNIIYYMMIY